MSFTIGRIKLFVSQTPKGDEGVIVIKMGNYLMPMLETDDSPERMELLFPKLQQLYAEGVKIKVLEFTNPRDVTADVLIDLHKWAANEIDKSD